MPGENPAFSFFSDGKGTWTCNPAFREQLADFTFLITKYTRKIPFFFFVLW